MQGTYLYSTPYIISLCVFAFIPQGSLLWNEILSVFGWSDTVSWIDEQSRRASESLLLCVSDWWIEVDFYQFGLELGMERGLYY